VVKYGHVDSNGIEDAGTDWIDVLYCGVDPNGIKEGVVGLIDAVVTVTTNQPWNPMPSH
jgi:hypothetical protein